MSAESAADTLPLHLYKNGIAQGDSVSDTSISYRQVPDLLLQAGVNDPASACCMYGLRDCLLPGVNELMCHAGASQPAHFAGTATCALAPASCSQHNAFDLRETLTASTQLQSMTSTQQRALLHAERCCVRPQYGPVAHCQFQPWAFTSLHHARESTSRLRTAHQMRMR